jgi:hypothetical protein
MQTTYATIGHQVQPLHIAEPNRSNRGYRPEDQRQLSKPHCQCGRRLQSHDLFDYLCDYCLDEMASQSEAEAMAWGWR